MSRVLFVENRHQTRTWEVIASGLEQLGHSVFWLVMNHGFAPDHSSVRLLPYPTPDDLLPAPKRFAPIVDSDRGIRYYGLTADHYVHYDRHIRMALEEIEPDVVVGEATQFYELLIIQASRDSKIPYIVPATARYPPGRFVCYRYDTLEVVGGSGEVPVEPELSRFAQQLSGRTIVPDYMKRVKGRSKWEQQLDWAYKAFQYARGERFSSPAPWKKLAVNRSIQRNLQAWDTLANTAAATAAMENKIRVLFPLHMQPEASIDVWGRPYSNQAALIEEMADALDDKAAIFIKPNPKSRCELSDSLLNLVNRHSAVVALPSTIKMQEAFERADLLVTVTGTVAIEAIFARKPCATLIKTRNNDLAGCRYLASPVQLGTIVEDIRAGSFPMHSADDVIGFAARLFAESYPGIIQDPYSTPQAGSPQNKRCLVEAFSQIIPKVLAKKHEFAGLAIA